jgi:pilus assembly protein CpaB
VPVRLSDPGVADLLRPGSRVDVVASGPDHDGISVLAADAVVVTVRHSEGKSGTPGGRLVLVALPREAATRVAAASLGEPVAVTLR